MGCAAYLVCCGNREKEGDREEYKDINREKEGERDREREREREKRERERDLIWFDLIWFDLTLFSKDDSFRQSLLFQPVLYNNRKEINMQIDNYFYKVQAHKIISKTIINCSRSILTTTIYKVINTGNNYKTQCSTFIQIKLS